MKGTDELPTKGSGMHATLQKSGKRSKHGILILVCLGLGLLGAALAIGLRTPAQEERAVSRSIVSHSSASLEQQDPVPANGGLQQAPASGPMLAQVAVGVPQRGLSNAAPSQIITGVPQNNDAAPVQPQIAARDDVEQEDSVVGLAPVRGKYYVVDAAPVFEPNTDEAQKSTATSTPYVVAPGDILGRIAKQFSCSIEDIRAANNIKGDHIMVGQRLLIPNCADPNHNTTTVSANNEDEPQEAAPAPKRGAWWKAGKVDTTTLPKLMRAEGFKAHSHFMAIVIEISFDPTRQVITRERAFDYNGSSSKKDGWNAASTVKLFAAIGALKRLEELGFSSRAKVTFHSKKSYTTTVSELIQSAIIQSNNIAYNRVVQLASFEYLHSQVMTKRYGIPNTALTRAYQQGDWEKLGENVSLRISPGITLKEGNKTHKIPASNSKLNVACSAAACTTLQDLAESTRRLMLQEQLPSSESYNLQQSDLIMLRRAMRAERTRGTEMVDIFAKIFKDERVKFYSKPGFSNDWFTDNVYIFDPRFNQAWIVTMSGYPGRDSLNSAAKAIATLISKGALRKIP